MTLNSGKSKVDTNQNLVSNSLVYKYLYQRTIVSMQENKGPTPADGDKLLTLG